MLYNRVLLYIWYICTKLIAHLRPPSRGFFATDNFLFASFNVKGDNFVQKMGWSVSLYDVRAKMTVCSTRGSVFVHHADSLHITKVCGVWYII